MDPDTLHTSETTLAPPKSPSLRRPCQDDAAAIHDLIVHCPPLDLNSLYAYLLLTHHHADTCIVAATENHHIVGFVSAYIPPKTPDVLFVWQVAVDETVRGTGLGKRMLTALLERPRLQAVQYLETTVSPDNLASQRMFAALARHYTTHISESVLFLPEHFGTQAHEPENLLRIGPFAHAKP